MSMQITRRAMLSRGRASCAGNADCEPARAARRQCGSAWVLLDTLGHGLDVLRGEAGECARK